MSRTWPWVLAAVVAASAVACGGGGKKRGGVLPSACIAFDAAATAAPSTVVARQAAGAQCEDIEVEIVISDVTDVFAVAFDVGFDPAVARYQGISLAGSLLTSDGADVEVLQDIGAGSVRVGVTRRNPAPGIDAVGARAVVRLVFGVPAGVDSGSTAMTLSNTQVLGSETPPVEKNGIPFFGGTLRIEG